MADLVVGETTCDGKKKMYELMAEIAADVRPRIAAQVGATADALEYWVRELEQFRAFLSERFATDVSRRQDPGSDPPAEPRAAVAAASWRS